MLPPQLWPTMAVHGGSNTGWSLSSSLSELLAQPQLRPSGRGLGELQRGLGQAVPNVLTSEPARGHIKTAFSAEARAIANAPPGEGPNRLMKSTGLPPMHCGDDEDRIAEMFNTAAQRAIGEKAQGMKTGPAQTVLKEALQEEHESPDRMQRRKAGLLGPKQKKCLEDYRAEVVKDTNTVLEKELRHVDAHPDNPEYGLSMKEIAGAGPMPEIPSRKTLLKQGPFPLEKRIAELAAHVYYLWGDARHLLEMSTGENANVTSHVATIENFAAKAHGHMDRLVKELDIPVSADPPHLPVSVSGMPLWPSIALLHVAPPTPGSPKVTTSRLGFL